MTLARWRVQVRLGDLVERALKPAARALRLRCLDKSGRLRAGSRCARRKEALNRLLR